MGFFSNLLRPFFVGPRVASALRARASSASRAITAGAGIEVRIVGRIDPSSPTFPAPFTGEPCVFWFVCFEQETYTGVNRSSGKYERYWEIQVRDASREPLVLLDEDGARVHVDLGRLPESSASGAPHTSARRDTLLRAPFLLDLTTEDVTARALANPSVEAFLDPGRDVSSVLHVPTLSAGGPHKSRCFEARLTPGERIAVFGAVSGARAGTESAYRSTSNGLRISGTSERPLVLLRP